MNKRFYSSHWFLKNQIFSLFPIANINANRAEICRVNLGQIFNKFWFLSFMKFSQYCSETSIIQILQRTVKIYILRQKLKKKNHLIIEFTKVRPIFSRKFNCRIHI